MQNYFQYIKYLFFKKSLFTTYEPMKYLQVFAPDSENEHVYKCIYTITFERINRLDWPLVPFFSVDN